MHIIIDQDEKFKWKVFQFIFWVLTVYTTIFALYHFKKDGLSEALRILTITLIVICVRISIPKYLPRKAGYHVFTIVILFHMLRLVYQGGSNGSNLFWIVMYPMGLFMYLGLKCGLRYSIGLFIILLVLISPVSFPHGKYQYPIMMALRFVFTFSAISLFSYLYEQTRLNYKAESAEYMKKLEDSKKELIKTQLELEKISYTDNLTGCYNRHYLINNIGREIVRAQRNHPISVILCDLDFFKKINDKYGHTTGDVVLKRLGAFLDESLRKDLDWVVRFGGEEFLIILPDTFLEEAEILAERIRIGFSEIEFYHERDSFFVTLSMGMTGIYPNTIGDIDFNTIYKQVDINLYKAKESGRNCLVASSVI